MTSFLTIVRKAALAAALTGALASTPVSALAPMDDARRDYSNCLIDLMGEHLDKKSSESEFKKATETGCAEKREAFVALVTKDEIKYGSNKSEATQYATEEADGIIAGFLSGYGNYASSGTRPVKG